MNRPSRTDEPLEGEGFNQSPNELSGDLTTNQDLNGIANARELRREDAKAALKDSGGAGGAGDDLGISTPGGGPDSAQGGQGGVGGVVRRRGGGGGGGEGGVAVGDDPDGKEFLKAATTTTATTAVREVTGGSDDRSSSSSGPGNNGTGGGRSGPALVFVDRVKNHLFTFGKFVGPGFMIAVAYIDPGNYATDIAAGASYRFRLLFIVLLSNLFAIFLQSLAIKLGTVSGLNLAEACRAFLPRWLNWFLYALAEAAIIATDLAEVIGTAIAINLLIPQVPLVAGCAISILDVMVILFFYRPEKSMKGLRWFEFGVVLLVLGVVVCFCIQLSLITDTPVGDVFRGYLPSDAITESRGLYQACGILGATVMPHSIYLGSGIVQPRLRDFDMKRGLLPSPPESAASSTLEGNDKAYYIPSMAAVQHSLKYAVIELAISLFTFALFVNSSILIVAGASLYGNEEAFEADIFAIHELLSNSISPAAGTIFALALLLSGVSAGIVCTIAGQMVSEGALNWRLRPWLRRLITRLISITPSIVIAGAVGRSGLDAALNASQVALSICLPFVTAPLIWFTCRNRYMTVQPGMARFHVHQDEEGRYIGIRGRAVAPAQGSAVGGEGQGGTGAGGQQNDVVKMANAWYTCVIAVVVWLIIACMNVANLVLLGIGD